MPLHTGEFLPGSQSDARSRVGYNSYQTQGVALNDRLIGMGVVRDWLARYVRNLMANHVNSFEESVSDPP